MEQKIINWIESNTFLGCLELIEFDGSKYKFSGLGEDDFEVEITVGLDNQVLIDGENTPYHLSFNVWSN